MTLKWHNHHQRFNIRSLICRTNISLSVTMLVSDFQEILTLLASHLATAVKKINGMTMLRPAVGFIISTSFASFLFFFQALFLSQRWRVDYGSFYFRQPGRCAWEPCNLGRRLKYTEDLIRTVKTDIIWELHFMPARSGEQSCNLLSTDSYCSRT